MAGTGKLLILLGGILVVVGVVLTFFDKIPYLGKLPGDFHVKKDNFEFYFPLATGVVLSLLLSGILWVINHFGKR
ncbi:MAG: DUF2905 domain-containing protein [Ignavibacteriales bacterium]|nr:DUF2905 domain-containing protein [Ignavibacteriales bacterium]